MTTKIRSNIDVTNRNAFSIINIVCSFTGNVYISKTSEERQADAKSLIGLLSLSIKANDEIDIQVSNTGDDSYGIMTKLINIFTDVE